MSPYGSWSRKSVTSPVPTASPTSILPQHRAKASGSNSSTSHRPETPTVPNDASPSPDFAASTRDDHDMKSTTSPTATKSPSPAPVRALDNKQKSKFHLFGRSASARVAPAETKKRKRLTKKSLSQPTFEILNPRPATDNKTLKIEAAQLGLQLEAAVAAIQQGSTNVSLARTSSEVATPPANKAQVNVKDDEPAQADIVHYQATPNKKEQQETKRWSNPPLLPELDFGSHSSGSEHLFDPETHKPPPRATVCISILTDTKSNSNDANPSSNKLTYRCDIHAQDGASHSSVEKACQNLVTSVGGRLLNSYFYPGGFLYRLPSGTPDPIATSELSTLEAKIEVEGWTAFSEPIFNGLRMHPPEGRLGGDRPSALTTDMTAGLKAREGRVLREVDVWIESQGGAAKKRLSDRDNTGGTDADGGEAGDTAHIASGVEDPAATPTRKVTLVKSLELLRRRVSSATRTLDTTPTSSKTTRSPGTNTENRYTVIMDTSESDSGSGAEEWESVRSEL